MDVLDGARIVGVYNTKQSRDLSPRTGFSLALEALKGAVDDAGMDLSEVDGIASYVSGWPPPRRMGASAGAAWAYQLNRTLRWSGTFAGIQGIMEAAHLIASGYVNTVAVLVGMVRPQNLVNAPWTEMTTEFTEWTGAFPVQPVQFGLVARRYIHTYGPDALWAMAQVGAVHRNYAHINPDAVYFGRGPFTAEDVLNSRIIADPLTLLMCSTVNDGGCGLVLTSKERARDTRKKPIRIITGAQLQDYPSYVDGPWLEGYHEKGKIYQNVMARAGVTVEDINVVEFYDHFASHVLMQYEEFGFCEPGGAVDLVRSGENKINGRWPTCTDGGNLAFSHPGFPLVFRPIECVKQIRGEVKDMCPGWEQGEHTHEDGVCRKIRDPKLAITTNPGSPTVQGAMMVLGAE